MTISAIIPVHNGVPFLAEAVASIQRQTLPADEIILIDDASTDETPDMIARLAQS
ncbi:MAG: glycosyltransferase, partial [Chloroflexota bacterium]